MTREKLNKKAQTKIQEMAFVLIAIIIFFAMVALVYFSIRLSSLKADVSMLREQGAKETARKLSDIPEFSWQECSGCLDLDKIMVLKGKEAYKNFWEIDYLAIERTYPERAKTECTSSNYPDCSRIVLINKTKDYGSPVSAFVALCWFDFAYDSVKCELGKIYASAEAIS